MTTIAEGWETKLVNGFGQHLATAGCGVWEPPSGFTEADVAITADDIPDTPTRLITLSLYLVDDMPGIADARMGLQVRVRGDAADPRVRNDIASACYDALHGLTGVTLNGISVVQVSWQSGSQLGQDPSTRRYERADNYYVDAMRPNALNPD